MGKKRGKFIYYSIAFLIPVITLLINIYRKDCYPFGNEFSILIGDSKDQYVQFFQLLYDRITEGKSFLFSWDTGMGFDFLSNCWYYMSNPCNWLILLFGRDHIELGMVCVILLQVGGCAVTSMYYFMHSKINKMQTEKWNTVVCLLFSIAYALCDYVLAYKLNIMWMMGLMITPLIMLGVEYLVDKNDGRLYGILLFLGFVSNFYFAWFLCIWAVICFIEQKKVDRKHWEKAFFKFIFTSITAALCAAVILVPAYFAVLTRNNVSWHTMSELGLGYHDDPGNFFNGFFWAHNLLIVGETIFTQNNYCGVFVLVFMLIYFLINI